MSVELLDLITNYRIVCYNDDSTYRLLKRNWDIKSYLNNIFDKEPDSDKVAEILLKDHLFVNNAINDTDHNCIIFFYMNRQMDELIKKISVKMLLPAFNIQEKLGNKIFLSEICRKLKIPVNISLAINADQRDVGTIFKKCKKELGIPFIVQDTMGVSGWDTSLVSSIENLCGALKKIKNDFRATKYIPNNIPLSVHACILDDEIIIRGPWLQVIGFKELSCNPFRFNGNDTNQSLLNKQLINSVLKISKKISRFAKNIGYRGILGIDYLWDKGSNTVYPQEINSRLVGLTRLLTGIQKDQLLLPDLIRHIEAFTHPILTEKCLNMKRFQPIPSNNLNYSQLIIRNNTSRSIKIVKRLEPGIYKVKNGVLKKINSSLFVHDMLPEDILITYAAHLESKLPPDEVIVRLILKKSVVDNSKYELSEEVRTLIRIIKSQSTSSTQ